MDIKAVIKIGPWGSPTGSVELGRDEVTEDTEAPQNRSATGYGAKMPTRFRVWHNNRWKRVYAAVYGNAATHFIMSGKDQLVVDFY